MARGRPRKVEARDALHSVMITFWKNGYAGTSMNDLAEASGLAKPGLYARFGDKEALFEKALLHYFETIGGPIFLQLGRAKKHVIDDLRDFLGAVAALTLDANTPPGCFLVNSLVDCASGPSRQQELVKGLRESRYGAIRARLLKGVAAGEIPAEADVDRMATFVDGQFSAISMLGRSGSTGTDLGIFIETGLRALPVVNAGEVFERSGVASPTLRR